MPLVRQNADIAVSKKFFMFFDFLLIRVRQISRIYSAVRISESYVLVIIELN
jgi:hypothetical protein